MAAMWLYYNFCNWLTLLNATLPAVGVILIVDYFTGKSKYEGEEAAHSPVNWAAIIGVEAGAVVAMCIEGKTCSSEALSKKLADFALEGKSRVTFLIGGSFGLDETLKKQADWRLSMSPMTFPHHLARIMLLEQIYRACQIAAGTKYHK